MDKYEGLINIEGHKIKRIEFKNQSVVTFRMVDELHQRPESTARQAFNRNKGRFIENEDYFYLPYDEWKDFSGVCETYASKNENQVEDNFSGVHIMDGSKNHYHQIFLTQSGYLLLVKAFNDDLAWKIQRALIKRYFYFKGNQTTDQLRETMKKERLYLTEKRSFDKLVRKEAQRILSGLGTIDELSGVPHIQQAVRDALPNETFRMNPVVHLLESIYDVYRHPGPLGGYPFKNIELTDTRFLFESSSRTLLDFSTRLCGRNREPNSFSTPHQITDMLKKSAMALSSFNWEVAFNTKIIRGSRMHRFVKAIGQEKKDSNCQVILEN